MDIERDRSRCRRACNRIQLKTIVNGIMVEQTPPIENPLSSPSIRFFDFRPSACPPKQTFLEIHEYAIHEY